MNIQLEVLKVLTALCIFIYVYINVSVYSNTSPHDVSAQNFQS